MPQRFTQTNQWVDLCFVALKQATPAQIVRQVLDGHTMKMNHPVFEPTIVGVYVLDVEVGLLATAISHHQYRDLLGRQPAFFG